MNAETAGLWPRPATVAAKIRRLEASSGVKSPQRDVARCGADGERGNERDPRPAATQPSLPVQSAATMSTRGWKPDGKLARISCLRR